MYHTSLTHERSNGMIIVGLGNPGEQYKDTRHNIGFQVLDALADRLGITDWRTEQSVQFATYGAHWLIKPQEFMNVSGASLKKFLAYKHVPCDPARDLIVVHDEIDFELGAVKLQAGKSSAGHNGVQSIIDAVGTQDFSRLRVDIGSNRPSGLPAEEYVLREFPAEDEPAVADAVAQAVELLAGQVTE